MITTIAAATMLNALSALPDAIRLALDPSVYVGSTVRIEPDVERLRLMQRLDPDTTLPVPEAVFPARAAAAGGPVIRNYECDARGVLGEAILHARPDIHQKPFIPGDVVVSRIWPREPGRKNSD